jgi:FimV-like protein
MTVMTVSTLAVLLLILIIVRSGIVTRRDVLVASEPAHSTAANEQSALADPVEQYIDEFLDDDVAINTELEIADAPTAENLLDASDSQPPISKTKLPFITVSDPMDAVDQPSTAASVDLSDFNSTATQLQLSRVYIDMGDLDGAKIMLEKVLATADTQELAIANDLISELEQLS